MSLHALSWVFRQPIRPASKKLLLLALADYADAENGSIFPTIQTMVRKTSLDRKTVVEKLAELKTEGLLVDTGVRRGRTGQVVTYRLAIPSDQESESVENDNESENGSVCNAGEKRSEFPNQEVRNRVDEEVQKRTTEPSGEPLVEPSLNPSPSGNGEVSTKPKRKSKKAEPAAVEWRKEFFALWETAYVEVFDQKYAFSQADAIKALELCFSANLPPKRTIEIAADAWQLKDNFLRKHSLTIKGLHARWNEISTEVKRLTGELPDQKSNKVSRFDALVVRPKGNPLDVLVSRPPQEDAQ